MSGHGNATALTSTQESILVGWTPESTGRGTWDIISTSLITIIICTWTVLHPRIHVGRKLRRFHKTCQFIKQILAPELETIEALQELIQARKAIKCCAAQTKNEMTLTQSFYIGMMGIRYRSGVDGGHCVLWPLQYAFLLNSGVVTWPPQEGWGLSVESIEDKSKADAFLKLAALWQVLWYSLQCITRGAHHMELAPLESMTLAYVVQVVLTYTCWWKKPKDIATASFVTLPELDADATRVFRSLAMEVTYDVPDPATTKQSMGIAWYVIPRDCGEKEYQVAIEKAQARYGSQSEFGNHPKRPSPIASGRHFLKRARALEELERGEMPGVKSGGSKKDETTVVTEWDDSLYWTAWWPVVCVLGCSFGAVHMISWNAEFPTQVEQWLWRASSIGSIATALVTMQFKKITFKWQGLQTIVQIGSPVLYVLCRITMIAETIAAFRALPPSVYSTYEIVNYWFHFF